MLGEGGHGLHEEGGELGGEGGGSLADGVGCELVAAEVEGVVDEVEELGAGVALGLLGDLCERASEQRDDAGAGEEREDVVENDSLLRVLTSHDELQSGINPTLDVCLVLEVLCETGEAADCGKTNNDVFVLADIELGIDSDLAKLRERRDILGNQTCDKGLALSISRLDQINESLKRILLLGEVGFRSAELLRNSVNLQVVKGKRGVNEFSDRISLGS